MAKDIPIEELYSHPIVQKLLSKLEGQNIDLENIKIPYLIKNKVLMSPGVWNNFYYSEDAIKEAYLKSEWDNKEIRSLFLDHLDKSSREWIGEVKNPRLEGDTVIGDLIIVDKPTAQKLAYGAKMGISPKVHGMEEGNKMMAFEFDNFSVVINPAVKTAYINNAQMTEEEMQDKKKPYGKVSYADPGYQKDGVSRYPIDTEAHVRAAWSYIHQAKNAAFYTKEQLKKIHGKIIAAGKKFGVKFDVKQSEESKMAEEEVKDKPETPEEAKPEAAKPEAEAAKPAEEGAEKSGDSEEKPAEAEEKPAEVENAENLIEALSEITIKNVSVGAIAAKAKEIRKEGEPFSQAIKRAAKMMGEKPKEVKNSEMAEQDVINQILKLASILAKKQPEMAEEGEKKDEKKDEEEKKDDPEKEGEKMQEMEKTIKTLSEQLTSVEKKLNEPAPKTAMRTEELSAADAETMVQKNPDVAFLSVLQRMGGM